MAHHEVRSSISWRVLLVLGGMLAPLGGAEAEWEPGSGFRSRRVGNLGQSEAGFTSMLPEQTGVYFTNQLSEARGLTNQIYYSGSGVAAGDVDGDGRPDLYFCGGEGSNALYRNLGDWRFEEIAERTGVRCEGQASTGAVLADVDGDGDLDLLVGSIGAGVRLFRNDAQGKFEEVTASAGLKSQRASFTLALADVEGDGDLDLYVTNYRSTTFQDAVNISFEIKEVGGQRRIVAVDGRPTSMPDLVNRYTIDARGTVGELDRV